MNKYKYILCEEGMIMDSIGEALKIFLEKHLYPTLIAIVVSIGLYLILPDEFYIIKKLGFWCFLIFSFAIAFLFVQLVILFTRFCRNIIIQQENQEFRYEQIERDNKKALEDLWSYVDSLRDDDFLLLQKLLENDNNPIKGNINVIYLPDSLLNSNLIHSSIVNGERQYILNESFYRLLKYSKEQYGRISHFR